MLKIALVDDNELDAKRLENAINMHLEEIDIKGTVDIFTRAVNFLEDKRDVYDVIFLDIDMPFMSGMECAHKLREAGNKVPIIFETNYSSLAIDGYSVNALGFIVKPVKQADVNDVLDKLLEKIKDEADDEKIIVKVKSGYQSIPLNEIKYIEVNIHDLYYHCKNGTYQSRGVLKEIEKQLPNEKFVNCSNCYLVNLDYVDSIVKNDVKIGDDLLKISKNKKKAFIQAYLRHFN
ncbi:MAG: LytTR family DNA-binding domain-containing protein [Bacilli bacterium]|nr:LytTR family DNA-binding domain-containing protein [Bacilli bacterium]